MEKIKVAMIYEPHSGPPVCHYDGEDGSAWISGTKRPDSKNVGMSYYYMRNPEPDDSFMIIEPHCVNDCDYNPDYLRRFKKIFTWASRAFEKFPDIKERIIEVNHPSCRDKPSLDQMKNNWPSWSERADEIVFIANNKSSGHYSEIYSLRLALADQLHKWGKFKVSWYGHDTLSRPYYRGRINSKMEILQKVKFSICTENCYDHEYSYNYFTEKMPEVWWAGAVPIYMGCYNVDDFNFPKESYIDLRNHVRKTGMRQYTINGLEDLLLSYNENNFNQMRESMLNNMAQENGLYYVTDYDRMYKKIISSFK